ncbi:MAG: hypothetical protein EOO77_39350 [Oxalobacteraceae bacterium]|nr:MAG: hypothetical protein EOO77_39350 [Oxalobacteraceae bacterium]
MVGDPCGIGMNHVHPVRRSTAMVQHWRDEVHVVFSPMQATFSVVASNSGMMIAGGVSIGISLTLV